MRQPAISEREFMQRTIQLARATGWLVAHFRPAQTSKGWRTPVSADGKGFPDVVMVKGSAIIFTEFKSNKGRVSPEQATWLQRLHDAAVHPKGRVFVRTWRPGEHDEEIEQMLTELGR